MSDKYKTKMPWPINLVIALRLWSNKPHGKFLPSEVHSEFSGYARKTLISIAVFILLGLTVVWAVHSLCLDSRAGVADWFSRAGALIVIAAAATTYFAPVCPGLGWECHGTVLCKFFHHVYKWFGFICLVAGTLIWAYGDKFTEYLGITGT